MFEKLSKQASKKYKLFFYAKKTKKLNAEFLGLLIQIHGLVESLKEFNIFCNDRFKEAYCIWIDFVVFINQVGDSTDIGFWLLQSRHIQKD